MPGRPIEKTGSGRDPDEKDAKFKEEAKKVIKILRRSTPATTSATRKVSSTRKRKKGPVTAAELKPMTPREIKLLDKEDIEDIKDKELKAQGLSWDQMNAFRAVKYAPELAVSEEERRAKKRRLNEDLKALKEVKSNPISLTGAWAKHWDGSEPGDLKFQAYLREMHWDVEDLVRAVLDSLDLAEVCTFTPPPLLPNPPNTICIVQIDLGKFSLRLAGMYIAAAVTDECVAVFHAGPGGR
jgi:hypothetical protein